MVLETLESAAVMVATTRTEALVALTLTCEGGTPTVAARFQPKAVALKSSMEPAAVKVCSTVYARAAPGRSGGMGGGGEGGGGEGGEGGEGGCEGGEGGEGCAAPPPQAQHMVREVKSASS